MPKIQAENSGGKLLRKFAAENCCGKLLRKIAAGNLGGHTEFTRLVICDRTMADVEISAPCKISAPLKFLRLSPKSCHPEWRVVTAGEFGGSGIATWKTRGKYLAGGGGGCLHEVWFGSFSQRL
jgi:hypothetical protein